MDASPASGKDEFYSRLGTPSHTPPPTPDTGRTQQAGRSTLGQGVGERVSEGPLPASGPGFPAHPEVSCIQPGAQPRPTGGLGMSMACARLIFQKVVTTKIGR